MQIDTLGKRYGLLPSEVIRRSTTFDLYILDAALSFEKFHHAKAENKGHVPAEFYDQDTLMKIMQKAKQ